MTLLYGEMTINIGENEMRSESKESDTKNLTLVFHGAHTSDEDSFSGAAVEEEERPETDR